MGIAHEARHVAAELVGGWVLVLLRVGLPREGELLEGPVEGEAPGPDGPVGEAHETASTPNGIEALEGAPEEGLHRLGAGPDPPGLEEAQGGPGEVLGGGHAVALPVPQGAAVHEDPRPPLGHAGQAHALAELEGLVPSLPDAPQPGAGHVEEHGSPLVGVGRAQVPLGEPHGKAVHLDGGQVDDGDLPVELEAQGVEEGARHVGGARLVEDAELLGLQAPGPRLVATDQGRRHRILGPALVHLEEGVAAFDLPRSPAEVETGETVPSPEGLHVAPPPEQAHLAEAFVARLLAGARRGDEHVDPREGLHEAEVLLEAHAREEDHPVSLLHLAVEGLEGLAGRAQGEARGPAGPAPGQVGGDDGENHDGVVPLAQAQEGTQGRTGRETRGGVEVARHHGKSGGGDALDEVPPAGEEFVGAHPRGVDTGTGEETIGETPPVEVSRSPGPEGVPRAEDEGRRVLRRAFSRKAATRACFPPVRGPSSPQRLP